MHTLDCAFNDCVMPHTNHENLSSLIFEAHLDAILILATDYTIKRLNSAAALLLEATTDSLIGETFPFEINTSQSIELEIPTRENGTRFFQLSASQRNWQGEAVQIVTLREMTGPAHHPDPLNNYKSLLSASLNAISSGAIATDQYGNLADMNATAAELLNLAQAPNSGTPSLDQILDLVSAQTGQPLSDSKHALWQAAQATQPTERVLILNNRSTHPTAITVELRQCSSSAPVSQSLNNCLILLHRYEAASAMLEPAPKTEKCNSTDLLAAGIAHDFNNLLSAILGNVSLLQIKLGDNQECGGKLHAVETAVMQAKSLSQQLMTFSKAGTPALKTATVAQLIDDSAHFLLRGSNVKSRIEQDDALWLVEIDAGQICQVINNLIINADQAMPKGGTLQIRASNQSIATGTIPELMAGNYVCIEIEDQGVGIDAANLTRIFDPYYTTKHDGNGIGLASSFTIIKNHGGLLTAESTLEQGSTFRVYLPQSLQATEQQAATALSSSGIEQSALPTAIHQGQGRILVMDDMEAMMNVAGEILSVLGYQVEFSTHGQEAIDLYKQADKNGRRFDAVVFDLTVPGAMGGEEAAEILIQYDPDLMAIASSGYSSSDIMSNYKDSPFQAVVPKPYRIKEMSDTLNQLLPSRTPAAAATP